MPTPVVVLASGRGSNLQALIDARAAGRLDVDIRAVASDKPSAFALERGSAAGLEAVAVSPKDFSDRGSFDAALLDRISPFEPRLVICAGYMRILSPAFVAAFHGRLVNIHPSLLPKYPGLKTHDRALAAGDPVHGASVHFVTNELDGGPVIARTVIEIVTGDTPSALAARLLPREHELLVSTIDLMTRRLAWPTPAGVTIDGRLLSDPLTLHDDGRLLDAAGFVA